MRVASIALRNLSRQKTRTILLASAIAFGVLIISLVNGFSFGTVRILKENFAELFGGHIFISQETKVGDRTIRFIDDDSKMLQALKELGITENQVNRSVSAENAELVFGSNKSFVGAVVGLDWNKEVDYIKYLGLQPDEVASLVNDPYSLLMNKKTADKLKIAENDNLLVRLKTVYGQENIGEFNVRVITQDTSDFNSFVVFVQNEYMRELLNLPNKKAYSSLYVRMKNLDEAEMLAPLLKDRLSKDFVVKKKDENAFDMSSTVYKEVSGTNEFEGTRIDVQTISDMFSFLNDASIALAIVSIILFLVLLGIIMVGIGNTFRMILFERTREIGTLRALGMQRGSVQSMMLMEALFLALGGVVAGLVLSSLLMVILGLPNFGTDSIASLFLRNGHLSFLFDPTMVILIVVLVSIMTLLAALLPARKAARLEPANALRANY